MEDSMIFTVSRQELLRSLKLTKGIATAKGAMPILGNVVLTAELGRLTVAATDLVVSVSAEMRSFTEEEGAVAILASSLTELAANAAGDEVHFAVDEKHWAKIKAGKAKYSLAGQDAKSYPSLPEVAGPWISMESTVLQELIDRTIYACATDENRANMAGIYVDGDLRMTTTDGHRVACAQRGGPLARGVILPRKGAEVIRALSMQGPMTRICFDGKHMHARQDETTISVRLIDAVFPIAGIQMLESGARPHVMTVDRLIMLQVMKRSSLVTTDSIPIRLALNPTGASVVAINPDMGEVSEDLPCDYAGPSMTIGLNPKYMVDLLMQMSSDSVKISMAGELEPAMITGSTGYWGVILPMRVT